MLTRPSAHWRVTWAVVCLVFGSSLLGACSSGTATSPASGSASSRASVPPVRLATGPAPGPANGTATSSPTAPANGTPPPARGPVSAHPQPEPGASAGPPTATPGPPGATASDGPPVVISHGPSTGRRIALTFDANMTDDMLRRLDRGQARSYANVAVLDKLQAEHVPATFFLASKWVQRYPQLTRRIAADPSFELASHSYAHQGFTDSCYRLEALPVADMAQDVIRSFDVLAPFGGRQTRYFRFPGGCYDAAALQAISPARCTVIQYDVVGGDPFNANSASIVTRVLGQAHPGAIVVLHITQDNAPRTADALPEIVSGLRGRGYELVTLSDLLG